MQTTSLRHGTRIRCDSLSRRPIRPIRPVRPLQSSPSPTNSTSGDGDCHAGTNHHALPTHLTRRTLGTLALTSIASTLPLGSRAAFSPPPPGYNLHEDKLDGYSFLYPDSWLPVTSSGNDCFYRNAFDAEENLFVDVSSPSSSKYESIEQLGSPEEVAEKLKKEYLDEFLSTRIGVKREGRVLDAVRREGGDGRTYYDVRVGIVSYASTQQLAVTFKEVEDNMVKEFDRSYLTTLGVAGGRLYSLRIQTSSERYAKDVDRLDGIRRSFKCKEVDV